MYISDRKERFSLAYVGAVAAHAGYQVVEPPVDRDSIDGLLIAQEGRRPRIEFQAKATSRNLVKEEVVEFPLSVKNYDDLRAEVIVPRLLIVVVLPDNEGEWLLHNEEELRMRRCGYWLSLAGRPTTSNTTSVTVHLPRQQQFSTTQVQGLMRRGAGRAAMKVKIDDRDALAALSWVDLKAYLDAAGWRHVSQIGDKAAVYSKDDEAGRSWEILAPLRDDLADYPARLAEAVSTLARVENCDERAVFIDLSIAGADVVRLRAPSGDHEGTISLIDGVVLHREAENLILAAACAAREPRRSYHARKIAEVRDYLQGVRLGQTEHGSYVLTIHSPVAPALRKSAQPTLGSDFEDEPFGRAVILQLAEALQSSRDAVRRAISEDSFDAFEDAVERGVNANFCDALGQLAEHAAGLDVSIAWARVRPTAGPARDFHVSRDMARVLKEAAVEFRRNEPKLDETVEGFVTHLDRPPEQFDGRAVLRVILDGRPRRVRVNFEPSEYRRVLKAHDERVAVSLDGDIYSLGRRWELRNPRNLRLLSEPEEPDSDIAPATIDDA